MLATHFDAEKRYSQIRREALNATSEILKNENGPNISLTGINSDALNASKEWNNSRTRIKNWDWIEGYSVFKSRYPKRFEMALWESKKLIGLSMGRPTYQGTLKSFQRPVQRRPGTDITHYFGHYITGHPNSAKG